MAPNLSAKPVGLALVGLGRIGSVHFINIMASTRLTLKYIVDVDVEAANSFAVKCPGAKATTDFDQVLKDDSVQGVVICTPTATHRDLIMKCIKAKKPVLCEKPISLDLAELDECYLEAKKNGVPLVCGYQRRHDPSFKKLRDLCQEGKIGQIQIVKSTSRDNPSPKPSYLKISGKIFHDCGSHDIDMLRYILGEDPVEVFCHASVFNPEIKKLEDWDTVLMSLKYPSGIIASIDLSRKACYGYDQRIEVLGSKGMLQANNLQATSTVLATDQGFLSDVNAYSFPERYEKTYAIELEHFYEVLVNKAEPLITHEDARMVSIIASTMEESAIKGEKVCIDYDKFPLPTDDKKSTKSNFNDNTTKTKKRKKN